MSAGFRISAGNGKFDTNRRRGALSGKYGIYSNVNSLSITRAICFNGTRYLYSTIEGRRAITRAFLVACAFDPRTRMRP